MEMQQSNNPFYISDDEDSDSEYFIDDISVSSIGSNVCISIIEEDENASIQTIMSRVSMESICSITSSFSLDVNMSCESSTVPMDLIDVASTNEEMDIDYSLENYVYMDMNNVKVESIRNTNMLNTVTWDGKLSNGFFYHIRFDKHIGRDQIRMWVFDYGFMLNVNTDTPMFNFSVGSTSIFIPSALESHVLNILSLTLSENYIRYN